LIDRIKPTESQAVQEMVTDCDRLAALLRSFLGRVRTREIMARWWGYRETAHDNNLRKENHADIY
jgi:hypothetical protein